MKLLNKLFLFLILLQTGYCYSNPTAFGAAIVAKNTSERLNMLKHEQKYHTGELIKYNSETYIVWLKVNDNFYYIETYEKDYYCYENDPKKCFQKSKIYKIDKREATPKEIYEYKRNLKIYYFIIVSLIGSMIVAIIGVVIYDIFYFGTWKFIRKVISKILCRNNSKYNRRQI